jgi:hypothetical protein
VWTWSVLGVIPLPVMSRVAQRAGCISDRPGPRSRLDLDCSDHWAG